MREIKFRGKRADNGEWVEGDFAQVCYGGKSKIEYQDERGLHYFPNVIPKTVGQYTGLKDKNDKEIFEGDIVKVNCPYSFKLEVGTICYNDGCFDIIGNTGGRDYLKCHTANHAVKVIGNIYDNPELLEGTTNSKQELVDHCIALEKTNEALRTTFEIQYANCLKMIDDMKILNSTLEKARSEGK